MLSLTVIGGEFTVSGFDRLHEVGGNDHGRETDVALVLPHQGPERQPEEEWLTSMTCEPVCHRIVHRGHAQKHISHQFEGDSVSSITD